jgi:hypothetical protein
MIENRMLEISTPQSGSLPQSGRDPLGNGGVVLVAWLIEKLVGSVRRSNTVITIDRDGAFERCVAGLCGASGT